MRERFGEAGWEAVFARLSAEDRERIASLDPGAWYDVRLLERLVTATCQQFKLEDSGIMEIGRFDAERELSGVNRWFLRLMRPSFAIRHMNLYWRRSHDSGIWRSWQQGSEVYAELRDWVVVNRSMCLALLGYLNRMLELFGGRSVSPLDHSECRALGHPTCLFRTHIELPADEPRPGRRPTRADVSAVARELAQCPDRETLSEAMITLLRFQLGCGWVELWSTGQDERMQLLGVSGERGPGEQRRFVLELAGRTVGRLEVELPHGLGQGSVDEVLNELVPWFAVALEVVRTSRSEPPEFQESELQRRLRRARDIAQLTPRQVEVLELVARGKTNKEIAAALGRSEGTVEVHVTNLLRKYGASNRAGLVALFWGEL